MPRLGVSYLEVAQAATKLVEQNNHPSIEAVRHLLKTGSNSTIARHLRDWREKQGNSLEAQKGLPESLLIAVKGLYDAIKEEADNQINATKTEANQAINHLQTELSSNTQLRNQLVQENHSFQSALNHSREETLALQRQTEELKRHLDKKIDEEHLLHARLQDKKDEVDRLILQVKNAQNNLDHYRESLRQEREADVARFEQAIKKLEQEALHDKHLVAQLNEKTAELSGKITWLEKDKEIIAEQLNQTQIKLSDSSTALLARESAFNELTKKHESLLKEHNQLKESSIADKSSLNTLNLKLGHTEGKLDVTTKALKKAEDTLVTMSDKQLFLVQEKTALTLQLKQFEMTTA